VHALGMNSLRSGSENEWRGEIDRSCQALFLPALDQQIALNASNPSSAVFGKVPWSHWFKVVSAAWQLELKNCASWRVCRDPETSIVSFDD
jgi:hypothetical protein